MPIPTNPLRGLIAASALGLIVAARAQETPLTLQLEQVASGLTRIVDIAHCGDDRLFAVQQAGRIRIVQPDGSILPTDFLNITSQVNSAGNEQGLLGLAFDPGYATNGRFYVYYTTGSGSGTSRLSRFTVSAGNPNVADAASEEVLYTRAQPYTNHNGGDIEFGPDGMLYLGFGDGGSGGDPGNNAQNMASALGKMLRLDVSGASGWAVPADNPFASANPADTLREIFAYGLRNPWRWGFDALTGDLWIGDVGQDLIEEVDFWPAGDLSGPNFGWRCYEGNSAYNTSGCQPASAYVAPVATHTHGQGWCSVIGGRVYRGPTYWRLTGRYLYTDYCAGRFFSLVPDGSGGWTRAELLNSGVLGWSVIAENSAGELFAGDNNGGKLYRIKEACTAPPPVIDGDAEGLTSSAALAYQWYRNGTLIAGATGQAFTPTQNGSYQVLGTVSTGCKLLSNAITIVDIGIDEAAMAGVSIGPVPADASVRIEGAAAGTVAELIDAEGRAALPALTAKGDHLVLATAQLAAGMYTLRLTAPDGRAARNWCIPVVH